MDILNKYLNRTDFAEYGEFKKEARIIIPDNFNFGYDVVDVYAEKCPDKIALVWCNDKGEEKIFTFKALSTASDKLANALMSRGIKKGDFVMTMLGRRYEYWITAAACHKLGAVLVPATTLLTGKDISYRCNYAEVKVLIVTGEDEIIKHVKEALPELSTVTTLYSTDTREGFIDINREISDAESVLSIPRPTVNDDMLLVYFTSGTTGEPKMVAHKQLYPLGHIITAKYWQQVVDDGLHFTMAESGWAKCSWGKIYGQWLAGSAVFAYDYFGKFTPTDILPLLSKYGVTTFCAPPTIYRFLIKENVKKEQFATVVHASTAGEALNPEVFKQFAEITGLRIHEGFGQTESTVILATFKGVNIKEGSMGKPSPIYDIFLSDADENEVPVGETGEISIRLSENGVGLFYRYHKDEARTENTFHTGVYHTGDLAYADRDGYYWFVGRKDDIIKSSGYRIGPFEVESALHEHPAVRECAITGAPDPLRGQIVKATIVLTNGYTPSDGLVKELQQHVKRATAPYKYPRIIEFVDELPKTFSGKIRRVEIREKSNKSSE